MRALCLAATLLAASAASRAQDLPPAAGRAVEDAQTMRPDAVKTLPGEPGKLKIRVVLKQGARWIPVPYLTFHAALGGAPPLVATDENGVAVFDGCHDAEAVSGTADLTQASFAIRPLMARFLAARGACGQALELEFERGNPSAAALRAWRLGMKAQVKLAGAIGPSAWPKGVVFHVNADGATRGTDVGIGPDDTTFVVGHELGHAISNAHEMIQMGFGDSFHTKTGCIGDSAALEEGWASFFGAWVDQGFETVDPVQEWDQRHSLPIKALPADILVGQQGERAQICAGSDNELRVLSFLWNVTAPDGLGVPMAVLWKTLDGKHLASVVQVARGLERQGTDRARLAAIWTAAFQRPYPPSL